MGNRAVICHSEEPDSVGIYLHWNGGLESVLAFLDVAKDRGYRLPASDEQYSMARLCGLICEYFEGSTSVGIGCLNQLDTDNYDNGTYLIGGNWEIIKRFGDGSEPDKLSYSDLNHNQTALYHKIKGELSK